MFNTRFVTALRWLFCLVCLLPSTVSAEQFSVERLNGGEPILSAQHFQQLDAPATEGANINGPSVIRIPDWIPPELRTSPLARYYMYFAHHSGDYIRLAWARDIEGPWRLYQTGGHVAPGERGVLDMGADRTIELASDLSITSHIASPDVHVDDDDKQIVMYFHGVTRRAGTDIREQQTYVATSASGLDFSARIVPFPVSGSYLRVFEYEGVVQGLTPQEYYRARDSDAPWDLPGGFTGIERGLWESHKTRILTFREDRKKDETGRRMPIPRARHLGLYRSGHRLHVFFTMKKHSPERILATSVDLTGDDWFNVVPQQPVDILRAQREWEGAMLTPGLSRKGAVTQQVNALRDPFVFSDEGQLYLFYVGGGEQAIGLARLTLQRDGE